MKLFKQAAEKYGYNFYYDRSLRMWALTKEDCESHYFSAYVLTHMGLHKFIQTYLLGENDND